MSVSAFIPLVEPLVRLIVAVLEGASRSDDPRRYLERRIEAEVAHRAAQEAARAKVDGAFDALHDRIVGERSQR